MEHFLEVLFEIPKRFFFFLDDFVHGNVTNKHSHQSRDDVQSSSFLEHTPCGPYQLIMIDSPVQAFTPKHRIYKAGRTTSFLEENTSSITDATDTPKHLTTNERIFPERNQITPHPFHHSHPKPQPQDPQIPTINHLLAHPHHPKQQKQSSTQAYESHRPPRLYNKEKYKWLQTKDI